MYVCMLARTVAMGSLNKGVACFCGLIKDLRRGRRKQKLKVGVCVCVCVCVARSWLEGKGGLDDTSFITVHRPLYHHHHLNFFFR